MAKLQQPDYRSSQYERPNKKYLCGHAKDGHACQLGPDKRGHCRTTSACAPIQREGRWYCSRSELMGGQCEQGPLPDGACCQSVIPCQPQRSWRSKRNLLSLWVLLLCIGILLIGFNHSKRLQLINPGELSAAHSGIAECSACHQQSAGGFSDWAGRLFSTQSTNDNSFDFNSVDHISSCQSCHVLGDNALQAHGLSSTELNQLSDVNTSQPSASITLRLATSNLNDTPNALACHTCHQEHAGSRADITAISDQQCTACHQNQFSSFAEGHPEFSDYPYQRRTHINFDHASHLSKHFEDEEFKDLAKSQCVDCHQPDKQGVLMTVRPFNETCASCHGEQIVGAGRASAKGFAVLNIPGIDIVTMQEQGWQVGQWPEDAEDQLTPFAQLLLATTPGFTALQKHINKLDMLDLSEANEQDLQAVYDYIWLIKAFYYDLSINGSQTLQQRLNDVSNNTATHQQTINLLLAGFPPALMKQAKGSWFPHLFEEIKLHNQGKDINISDIKNELLDNTLGEDRAMATTDDEFASLFADSEDEETNANSNVDLGADTDNEFAELFGEDEELIDPELEPTDDDLDDWLNDELNEDAGNDLTETLQDELTDDELTEDELTNDELSDDSFAEEFTVDEDDEEESESQQVSEVEVELLSSEDRAAAGGWYQEDDVLRYCPQGHADQFTRAWANLITTTISPTTQKILRHIAGENTPGNCQKCHSIDEVDGDLSINWQASNDSVDINATGSHRFNRFSHDVHLLQSTGNVCTSCHEIAADIDYAESFTQLDPYTFNSNFKALDKSTCQQCHNDQQVSQNCQSCHNYHIPSIIAKTMIPEMAKPK